MRNIKAFLFDFWAPVTDVVNKPIKDIAVIFEDVKSTGSLREQNLKLKNENRKLKALNIKAKNQEKELLELKKIFFSKHNNESSNLLDESRVCSFTTI